MMDRFLSAPVEPTNYFEWMWLTSIPTLIIVATLWGIWWIITHEKQVKEWRLLK